jgi:cell division protein FtsQ
VSVDVTAGTSSGARRVIRIGEEEEAPPKDATAPTGMDPRVRARRISVRRAMGRRRLRWFVLGALAAVLAVAAVVVLRSPLLAVDRVEVDGAAYLDRVELADLVRDLEGSSLVSLDLGTVRDRLEADPWVKRARVSRAWPRTVRIEVVERVPVATYMGDDQGWRIIDSTGAVIAVLDPGHQPVDLVTIAADAAPNIGPGERTPSAIADAASVAPRLPEALRSQVQRIAVGSEGVDLVLGQGVVRLGSTDQLRDKLISTMVAMEELGPDRLAALSVLDVRAPRNPVATCDPVEACMLATPPAEPATA